MVVSNIPVRKIPLGRQSATGTYVTRKGAPVKYESALERDCLIFADYDSRVKSITEQPVKIANHVPDFLLETDAGPIIVDVKPETKLLEAWEDDRTRLAPTAEYCEEKKASYCFFTDAIRYNFSNRLAVLKFIDQFGCDESIQTDRSGITRISDELPLPVREVCTRLGGGLAYGDKRKVLARMVYLGELFVVDTTASEDFDDARVSLTSDQDTLQFLIPYERMMKRMETHPLRFILQSSVNYFEGMSTLDLAGHHYEVLDSSDSVSVLIRSSESSEEYRIALDSFPVPGGRIALSNMNSEEYFDFLKKLDVISALAEERVLSKPILEHAANSLGLGTRQIQRLVVRFKESGKDPESLLPPDSQHGRGTSRIHPKAQEFLEEIIEEYLDPKGEKTFRGSSIIRDLCKRIRKYNKGKPQAEWVPLVPPSTVYSKLNAISP
ncbi:MAG: hypothetical protein JRN67_09925, partial [Nitrososphaerota archaeon]|nr:hypothetical protein [Nitrososphaerota archaeon]